LSTFFNYDRRRAIGDAAFHGLRQVFARKAPAGLHVRRLELSFQPDGEDLLITAVYILECPDASQREPFVFDFTQTSLVLERFACHVATIDPPPSPGARPHVFPAVVLEAGAEWNGTRIELTLRWRREGWDAIRCLVVPDSFPTIIRRFRDSDPLPARTLVQITGDGHGELLRIGGVPAPPEISASRADLLQAVVMRSTDCVEAGVGAGQPPMIFSTRLVSGLRADEPGRMADMVRAIMRYLTSSLGFDPGAVIVGKHSNDATQTSGFLPHGACFNASPESIGFGSARGTPADFYLSPQLAGVWWGGGCKIVGHRAQELESALCLAYGLSWMDYIGEFDQLNEALDHCSRLAKSSIVKNWWKGARGIPRTRDGVRIALELYALLQDEQSGAAELIKQLNRQYWGKYVHRQAIAAALAEVGGSRKKLFTPNATPPRV
jgi:hypothetical protein